MTLFVLKLTLLLLLGTAVATLLRGRSAATRHLIWSLTLIGALVLAALAAVGPSWPVPMPQRETARVAAKSVAIPGVATSAPVGRETRRESPTAEAAVATQKPASVFDVRVVWLVGFVAMLAWIALGHAGLARISRNATPLRNQDLIEDAIVQSSVRRPVRVAMSASVSAPLTWGWTGPRILLPAEAATWPADRQRAALLHELAHIARNDYLIQLLAGVACALYWFHPVAWLALRNLRRESEQASDDRVLARGLVAPDYATHLVDVAAAARARRFGGLLVLSMACPSHLETRLRALLDETRARNVLSRRAIATAAIVSVLVLLPLAAARPEARVTIRPDKQSNKQIDKPLDFGRSVDRLSRAVTRPIGRAFRGLEPLGANLGAEKKNTISTPKQTIAVSPGETLILDLETGGSVELEGWDESRVAVDIRLGGRDGADTHTDVERVAEGVRVHATYTGARSSHSSSNSFSIRVPRRFNLRIDSAGGSVSIEDVEGTFEGSTGGGGFRLERVKGRADLSTGGGEIDVHDVVLDGQVSTGGGEVTLTNVHGNLQGSSGSGPVIRGVNEDVTTLLKGSGLGHVKPAGPRIDKDGGRVDFGDAPNGVSIYTGGGDVTVGRAAGIVEARTGGGLIEVGPVAGSVYASTGSGEINITIADAGGETQFVEVFTGNGNVVVVLPTTLDARFDIESAYTREAFPSHIDSVWELDHQPLTNWVGSEGTPRRYVRATGIAGGGRGLIKIKAVNGNVTLRRAR